MAGVADDGFLAPDPDDFFGTFLCTYPATDALFLVHDNVLIQGDGILGTCFHADTAEDTVVILVLQLTIIVVRLNKDPRLGRLIYPFFVRGAHLCT